MFYFIIHKVTFSHEIICTFRLGLHKLESSSNNLQCDIRILIGQALSNQRWNITLVYFSIT